MADAPAPPPEDVEGAEEVIGVTNPPAEGEEEVMDHDDVETAEVTNPPAEGEEEVMDHDDVETAAVDVQLEAAVIDEEETEDRIGGRFAGDSEDDDDEDQAVIWRQIPVYADTPAPPPKLQRSKKGEKLATVPDAEGSDEEDVQSKPSRIRKPVAEREEGWQPKDDKHPVNKDRKEIEIIIERLSNDPIKPPNEEEESRLSVPLRQWKLRPGLTFTRDARGLGYQSKYKEMEAKRRKILADHNLIMIVSRNQRSLQREVTDNPNLLRHAGIVERIAEEQRKVTQQRFAEEQRMATRKNAKPVAPTPELLPAVHPVSSSNRTFFPRSYGYVGTAAKPRINSKLAASKAADLNLEGSTAGPITKAKSLENVTQTQSEEIFLPTIDIEVESGKLIPKRKVPIPHPPGVDFVNFPDCCCPPPKVGDAPKTSVCNRAGVYGYFIPKDGRYQGIKGDYILKQRLAAQQPNEDDSDFKKYLDEPFVPQSHKNALEYYYNGLPDLNFIAQMDETDRICKRTIMSTGVYALYASSQFLSNKAKDEKKVRLWHPNIVQQMFADKYELLECGIPVKSYPSPPLKWVNEKQKNLCKTSKINKTISVNELDNLGEVPFSTVFLTLSDIKLGQCYRDIYAVPIQGVDLEGFLPYKNYALTYNALIAVVKLICEHKFISVDVGKRGLFYYEPDYQTPRDFDDKLAAKRKCDDKYEELVKKSTAKMSQYRPSDSELYVANKEKVKAEKEFSAAAEKLQELKRKLERMAKLNDIIVVLRFKPLLTHKNHEVVVVFNEVTGKILLFHGTQPTWKTNIRVWHPVAGLKQSNNDDPDSLWTKLEELVAFLNRILPRASYRPRGWGKSQFNDFSDENVKDKMESTNKFDNRICLCRLVEKLGNTEAYRKDEELSIPWYVGAPLSSHFTVPNADKEIFADLPVQKQLDRYIQNYFVPGSKKRPIAIPEYLMYKMMTEPGALFKWTLYYFKLRYLSMIMYHYYKLKQIELQQLAKKAAASAKPLSAPCTSTKRNV